MTKGPVVARQPFAQVVRVAVGSADEPQDSANLGSADGPSPTGLVTS